VSRTRQAQPVSVRQAFDRSFEIDTRKQYLVHNRTPCRILITHEPYGSVALAPLAARVVGGDRLAPFQDDMRELRQRHQLRVREYTGPNRSHPLQMLVWVAVAVLLAVVTYDGLVHGTLVTLESLAAAAAFLVAIAGVLILSAVREHRRRGAERIADTEEGDIEFGAGGAYYDGNDTVRGTKQIFVLLVVVVVAAVLPAIAIFVGSDAKSFLAFEGGLRVKGGLESRFVARMIQVAYTAVLALFPALMYFQFDQQRVGTIRGRWVRSIFRMDPQMRTLADVDARYGDQLAEASSYSTDSVRFLGGRHSPIVVATILISLGWTLLVVRTESFDFAAANSVSAAAESAEEAAERAEDAAAEDGVELGTQAAAVESAADEAARASDVARTIAGQSTGTTVPSPPTTDGASPPETGGAIDDAASAAATSAEEANRAEDAVRQPFFQLLVPTPSAATMAFLGAYFFAVYLVLRSYFRGDLRPKLYNQITARMVTVVVLAYLLTVLYADTGATNRPLWIAAFLAGVVPNTVLQRMGLFVTSAAGDVSDGAGRWRGALATAFATPRALTQVDGIDIYDSARLESEGITDVPSLAKSDLVSTMVRTRMPVEQLVDWTDQALLMLLIDDAGQAEPGGRIAELRAYGIRTATDLTRAAGDDSRRDDIDAIVRRGRRRGLSVCGLVAQLDDEPSMLRIRNWHENELEDLAHDCPTLGDDAVRTNGEEPAAEVAARN
jgi:hypothetical protein